MLEFVAGILLDELLARLDRGVAVVVGGQKVG